MSDKKHIVVSRAGRWLALLAILALVAVTGRIVSRRYNVPPTPTDADRARVAAKPAEIAKPAQPASPTANTSATVLAQYRAGLLKSRFGTMTIAELLHALADTPGGPDIQLIYQVLALRKQEALPVVKERLRTGPMWEKHMLTKFLRLTPWVETKPELLELATSGTEHWLPRQGALYALGSLGDAAIGPEVVGVLQSPETPASLQMTAISTLARIGYKNGATAITPFLQNNEIHVQLFAARALVDLGQTVDKEFLFSALQNADYVVRQEASEALWGVKGDDVTAALNAVATGDINEAARASATQALLRRQMNGLDSTGKAKVLRNGLNNAEKLTALWILRTALSDAGSEGRALVESGAARQDGYGERSQAYLVFADSSSR